MLLGCARAGAAAAAKWDRLCAAAWSGLQAREHKHQCEAAASTRALMTIQAVRLVPLQRCAHSSSRAVHAAAMPLGLAACEASYSSPAAVAACPAACAEVATLLKCRSTASSAATRAERFVMLLWALHAEEGRPPVGILQSERQTAAVSGQAAAAAPEQAAERAPRPPASQHEPLTLWQCSSEQTGLPRRQGEQGA